MDVGIFVAASALGIGIGLTLRRNGYRIFPSYYNMDMGALGNNQYYENQANIFREK